MFPTTIGGLEQAMKALGRTSAPNPVFDFRAAYI